MTVPNKQNCNTDVYANRDPDVDGFYSEHVTNTVDSWVLSLNRSMTQSASQILGGTEAFGGEDSGGNAVALLALQVKVGFIGVCRCKI